MGLAGLDAMRRVFLHPSAFQDDLVELDQEARHHFQRVLRMDPGERFLALDGTGRGWVAELVDHRARLVEEFHQASEPQLRLDLYLALAKGERFDRAVEKAAELGVARLLPITTERTQVKTPGRSKQQRWQRLAQAASALAGRMVCLEVLPPIDLSSALAEASGGWFVTQGEPGPQVPPERAIFIGPEGGFSPSEIEQARASSVCLVGLGARNLRVETAATAAITLALFLGQDLNLR